VAFTLFVIVGGGLGFASSDHVAALFAAMAAPVFWCITAGVVGIPDEAVAAVGRVCRMVETFRRVNIRHR
jgi:hypothetical protein